MNRSKFRNAFNKAAVAVGASMVSMSAFAQEAPTDVDGAAAYMVAKGAIALAVCAAITLITLGLKGTKLPRRG